MQYADAYEGHLTDLRTLLEADIWADVQERALRGTDPALRCCRSRFVWWFIGEVACCSFGMQAQRPSRPSPLCSHSVLHSST